MKPVRKHENSEIKDVSVSVEYALLKHKHVVGMPLTSAPSRTRSIV
jgi:hypothetical protein